MYQGVNQVVEPEAKESFIGAMAAELRQGYDAMFKRQWPSWLGGILIAVVALMIFLWSVPWGIAGGYRNWGDWIFFLGGSGTARPEFPWLHTLSVSNFGIFIGALASALLSREFKLRRAPKIEYVKGAIGGILMGTGAALASGCNVGGFYTAVGIFSFGGYAMMVGLGIGAYLGLRYLLWEMEHLPQKAAVKPVAAQVKAGWDWSKAHPYFGALILVAIMGAFYAYAALGQAQIGGLLIFGLLIGIIMHRSRFCFVRAFREPFMTGDADMVRAVAISLAVYGFGSAVIKYAYIQPPDMGVFHHWGGSFSGGLIFGIGMLLAGGCASSTLWRAAEGHTKLMVALLFFAAANPVAHNVIDAIHLKARLGKAYFLPSVLGWPIAIPVFILILLAWVLIANWNEKSEKFVIF